MRMRALLVLPPLMGLAPTGCDGSVEIAKEAEDASTSGNTPDAGPSEDSPVDAVAHAMDAAPAPDSSPGADAPSERDATTSANGPTTYLVEELPFVNLEGPTGPKYPCAPLPISVDESGQAACDLLYLLDMGDTCEVHPGFVVAPPDLVASVMSFAFGPRPVDASSLQFCLLPQLPKADWINGSCESSSSAGWCYLTGQAAGTCSQALIASNVGIQAAGGEGTFFLACGGTASPSSGIESSAASVGTACVPSPERSASFSGFVTSQVTLDEGNAACGTGAACVVNHFSGLTECPYGQPPDAGRCIVPGTSTPALPTVSPQFTPRLPKDAVYCSCRCANAEGQTDDGASYCACPSDYKCSPLTPALVPGDPLAGSYCIKSGTEYEPGKTVVEPCDRSLNPCP